MGSGQYSVFGVQDYESPSLPLGYLAVWIVAEYYCCQNLIGERGPVPLLLSFIPEKKHDRVVIVSIQQVVQAIKSSGHHAWIDEFEQEYGLIPTPKTEF